MKAFSFRIKLSSDAEPGTGLGGQLVNDYIPRDSYLRPLLPASHIKGLMRKCLIDIAAARNWPDEFILDVFGHSDQVALHENSAFRISDAISDSGSKGRQLIVRTAIGEQGVALDNSLRTTEAVATGTVFCGQIYSTTVGEPAKDLAWRLALLSIDAVGGNRNRGSGACQVELVGEQRSPGALLLELDKALRTWQAAAKPIKVNRETQPVEFRGPGVVLNVLFRAHSPICCPEIPDKTNTVTTGFSIPASAVQGCLLTHLQRTQPDWATALYNNRHFRAWPLQPCWKPNFPGDRGQPVAAAIRVSLTHRAAKYSVGEQFCEEDFHDEALEPKRTIRDHRTGAPLKGCDGVLLRLTDGQVKLWRGSDMPHVITSHGVHSEILTGRERNLFTVDAMAPLIWQGLVTVPEDAVDGLLQFFANDPDVSLGKSRTVRGSGELTLTPVNGIPTAWQTHTSHTVWIVQSPIALPPEAVSLQESFRDLADSWGRVAGVPVKSVWAHSGILFGWNRLKNGRQMAQRVVLPGSVIEFSGKLDDAWTYQYFTGGDCVAAGRSEGLGAISVHPGKANGLFDQISELELKPAVSDRYAEAIRLVYRIAEAAVLPSVSQIRAVQQQIVGFNTKGAQDYLNKQTKKTARIWADWMEVQTHVLQLLAEYPSVAARALEVLADLIVLKHKRGIE